MPNHEPDCDHICDFDAEAAPRDELHAAASQCDESDHQWGTTPSPLQPYGPIDWPSTKKWLHIAIVASITMSIPLASSIHTPALPQIAAEFSIDRSAASLSVPLYVLGFATGPLLFLPLSKAYGRLYIYNASNFMLLLGSLGCAIAPAFGWLLAFRFLAGCGGACALTQGSGTIADIIEKENRGKAVALMAFGTVWAPILGPVIGGHIAEKFGWRGCFWVLICVVTFNSAVTLLYMEETSSTHNITLPNWFRLFRAQSFQSTHLYAKVEEGYVAPPKPFKKVVLETICSSFRLLLNPLVCTVCIISSIFYSIQIFLYVDIPATYKAEYGFTPSQTGLAFLGNGLGMTVGLVTFGLFSDRIMIELAGKGPRKPEYRLPLMMLSVLLVSCGVAAYSLTAISSINWIYPILANGITGAGLYSLSMTSSTYLIDLSPERAADSATLLATVRFPLGAGMCALSEKLVLLIGRAVTKDIFAAIGLLSIPVVFYLYRYGEGIRKKHRVDTVID